MHSLHDNRTVSLLDFPPELVNEIFHDGCILSTQFCTFLCKLSKWTRLLALPYLYSTIVIKKHESNRKFSLALSQKASQLCAPTPDFSPKRCVESIWIEAVSNTIVSIFRSCRNLRHIALPPDNLLWLLHASSYDRLPSMSLSPASLKNKDSLHLLLMKASSDWTLVQYPQTTPPLSFILLEKVTHLRIGQMGSYDSFADFNHYPNLTHVAIPYHRPENQPLSRLPDVLNHPSVMVLVVVLLTDLLSAEQSHEAVEWFKNIRSTTSKICVVFSRLCDLQAEWEEEARRGLSIWAKAENFSSMIESQMLGIQ